MIKRCLHDRRASVTIIFGLALIGVVAAVGCGIDYAQAARSRAHLAASADAAALAAAKAAQTYMNANGSGAVAFAAAGSLAQAAMARTFAANQAQDAYSRGAGAVLTLTQDIDGTPIATVRATATAPTMFMRIVGIGSVAVAVGAQARGGGGTYYQIIFVVDVSNSMAIGGTPQDITNLQNDHYIATGNADGTLTQCAFACHDANKQRPSYASDYCSGNPADYFCHLYGPMYCPWNNCQRIQTTTFADKRAFAKQFGYKLKIDYVNQAISTFIAQLQPLMDKAPALYSVGIDTFGTGFTQLQPLTSNSAALLSAAGQIDVETATSPAANYGYTYTATALQSALANVSNVGDGSSATRRKTFFVFLSDGAEDVASSEWPYNRTVDVAYAGACAAIKAAGDPNNPAARPVMFAINASYYPIAGNDAYNQLISGKGLDVQMPATMQACATSSSAYQTYFSAADGPAIKAAVAQVFTSIFAGAARLSK